MRMNGIVTSYFTMSVDSADHFQLFEAEHALVIEYVGPCAVEPRGLEYAVEIEQHLMFGADFGGAVQEIDHPLVVTIHEIDLETLDAHVGIMFHDAFHVALEGVVARPRG